MINFNYLFNCKLSNGVYIIYCSPFIIDCDSVLVEICDGFYTLSFPI